jgi:A/G-specific adenine glycosylase
MHKSLLISKPLLKWFEQFGRHNLAWQPVNGVANTYYVWLSEIMLQQTQVTTVIDYFNNFIQIFPDLTALANADEDAVLAQWAGLGYYARARNLHKCAKIVVEQYQAEFPKEMEAMIALPGIGESTAAAILSISFGKNYAILDGNVKRVLARYHQVQGHYGQSATLKELWHLARQHTPNSRNADYTQAIMDLGATLCVRSQPDCDNCPLAPHCQAKKYGTQSQYPHPEPRKNKPTRTMVMLIYTNKDKAIYLEKRPSKGVWGGLWSFLECENDMKMVQQSVKKFDSKAQIEKQLPAIKHSFTHYHLMISPIIIFCPTANKDFQAIAKLKIGLPAPVKKIIAQLD